MKVILRTPSEQSLPERLRGLRAWVILMSPGIAWDEQFQLKGDELNMIADEIERQQAELKVLQEQISEVDEILIVNWVGPRKDGDYRKSLSDLISTSVMEHQYFQGELQKENDSLKAELERLRGEFALYKSEKADEILLLRSALDFEQKQHLESLDREQKLRGEREQSVLRTGCKSCRGLGHIERHRDDYLHFETDIGDICPSWHFETLPCAVCHSTVVAISTEADGEREQDTERLDWLGEFVRKGFARGLIVNLTPTGPDDNDLRPALDAARDAAREQGGGDV